MLEITEQALDKIDDTVNKTISLIDKDEDIRRIVKQSEGVSTILRAVADINDTPENRFVSIVVSTVISWTGAVYEGNREEWYRLNRDEIREFKPILGKYIGSLREALKSNNYVSVMDANKNYTYALYHSSILLTERP